MHYTHQAQISASADVVYELAAAIEYYPLLMEHHRWVEILSGDEHQHGEDGSPRRVRMASRQWGMPLPEWIAIQRRYPEDRRIVLEVVAGGIRGMLVEWRILETHEQNVTQVILTHDWEAAWPIIGETKMGSVLSDRVIGPLTVEPTVSKTLDRIKELAEAGVSIRSAVSA